MSDYKLYGNAKLGRGVRVGDYAIIGAPNQATAGEEQETIIGDDSIIGPHSVIYSGAVLGKGVSCGNSAVIAENTVIGNQCSIGSNSVIRNSRIGDRVTIGDLVVLGILPLRKYDYRNVGKDVEPLVVLGDECIIRSHSSIYAQTHLDQKVSCGHGVRIRECTFVGNGTSIGTNTQIEGFCRIGNNVLIHTNAHIGQFSELEDDTYLAPGTVLTNTPHPLCPVAKQCLQGCVLRKGAKVSTNVTIAPRVVIGENALVGAGAVVTIDVAPNDLVVGMPAKRVKDVREITCPYGLIDNPYK